jgi:hypothetical protein
MRQNPAESERLSEAELIAATGISPRNLKRWRQQGLIPVIEPRRGLGRGGGRGTTPLEYPATAVKTIHRIHELRKEFKEVEEWRWRLWCDGYPVRIAPDLADPLNRLQTLISQIKTLEDVETKIIPLLKPAYMPRGHPLRVIFRDFRDEDLHSVATMVICFILGIRLPLFDEPNPRPFREFKRALGLPRNWQMPPGLFDVFPYAREQVRNALFTATAEELEVARAACRLMSRIFDNPENWRRGAIEIAGTALPWRPIKLVGLIWPSPFMRAVTVGLVILGMRAFTSALGEDAATYVSVMLSGISILFPEHA